MPPRIHAYTNTWNTNTWMFLYPRRSRSPESESFVTPSFHKMFAYWKLTNYDDVLTMNLRGCIISRILGSSNRLFRYKDWSRIGLKCGLGWNLNLRELGQCEQLGPWLPPPTNPSTEPQCHWIYHSRYQFVLWYHLSKWQFIWCRNS